jgi:hypothetical protein
MESGHFIHASAHARLRAGGLPFASIPTGSGSLPSMLMGHEMMI